MSRSQVKRGELNFDQVTGMEATKEILRRAIIYPLQHPELTREYAVGVGGGIIFYGPPGCGKTFLTKATAGEAGVNFIEAKISEILIKWVGDSEKRVSELFQKARANMPSILFFDEFDALGGRREEAGHNLYARQLVNTILTELSGATVSNDGILFIASTNSPWLIDPALKRKGRLGTHVYIAAPDKATRAALFKMYLQGRPLDSNIEYDKLAEMSELRSCTDIQSACEEAAKKPWKEAIETGAKRNITMLDISSSLSDTKSTIVEWYESARRYISENPREARVYQELVSALQDYDKFLRGGK